MKAAGLAAMVTLAACGGGGGKGAAKAPAGEGACAEPLALGPPGKRSTVRGVRAGVVCDDGDCALTVSAGGPTRSFELEEMPDRSEVGVRRVDLDGDGADELVVLATLIDEYGPEGQMEIVTRTLTVLDAETLELRWSTSGWGSTPPEEQSIACASEAELRDPDCDGRRDALVHVRRCDPPMCAGMRAGKAEDNEFVRDECGAREPLEERMTYRAGAARGGFVAVEADE